MHPEGNFQVPLSPIEIGEPLVEDRAPPKLFRLFGFTCRQQRVPLLHHPSPLGLDGLQFPPLFGELVGVALGRQAGVDTFAQRFAQGHERGSGVGERNRRPPTPLQHVLDLLSHGSDLLLSTLERQGAILPCPQLDFGALRAHQHL